MVITKWTIYWANLNPVQGSEQSGMRPVLLFSDDAVNVLNQVSVLPLTSLKDSQRHIYPNEVLVPAAQSGLGKDSVVLAHQIRTLDKRRFTGIAGQINDEAVRQQIEDAVRVQLGL